MRQVNLTQYLPPFMQSFRQPVEALRAENEEFNLLWTAVDKLFKNRFIMTADEDGMEHFESLLGITPGAEDTLEIRRLRVQSRWFNKLPYTIRVLSERLVQVLNGAYNFDISADFAQTYTLRLTVFTTDDSENENLKYVLSELVPLNMLIELAYEGAVEGEAYYGAVLQDADIITIKQRSMYSGWTQCSQQGTD